MQNDADDLYDYFAAHVPSPPAPTDAAQELRDALDDPVSDVDLLFADEDGAVEMLEHMLLTLAMLTDRIDRMERLLSAMQLDVRYCTQWIDRDAHA
jgi:hypothetical protein